MIGNFKVKNEFPVWNYHEWEILWEGSGSCSFDGTIISGNGSSDNGVSGGISLGYETVLFKQKSWISNRMRGPD